MNRYLLFSLIALSSVSYADFPACALKDIPVQIGDSLGTVQGKLATSQKTEKPDPPYYSANKGDVLWLRTKGIKVTFDKSDKVKSIALIPPATNPVCGVTIGDNAEKTEQILGKPAKRFENTYVKMEQNNDVVKSCIKNLISTTLTYYPSDEASLLYIFDDKGSLQEIRLEK